MITNKHLLVKKTIHKSKNYLWKNIAMLKVGVIGAGHLGKFHLNNWKEIEGIQLVGFVIQMKPMQNL